MLINVTKMLVKSSITKIEQVRPDKAKELEVLLKPCLAKKKNDDDENCGPPEPKVSPLLSVLCVAA